MEEIKKKLKVNAVNQAAAHNSLVTENIWQDFSTRLFNFIIKRVDNQDDAKDVLQDVFLKIHTKKDSLQDNKKLTAWIYQLTRNAIIDHYRTNKNKKLEIEELAANSSHNELINCLNPFIGRLSKSEKKLIQLVDLDGRRQIDVASKLGIPYPTLKSQLQRARKKLKGMFLECCNIELNRSGSVVDINSCKKCSS